MAAFEEAILTDMQLKCSGFINLTVYYESYLTAQDEERSEDGVEEEYKSLIQAQEQDMVEQTPIQLQECDLPEDEIEFPAEQVINEAGLPVSERELY